MQSRNAIGWQEWLAFLSYDGQKQIVEFVRQAKAERGANWIAEIQTEFPMLASIIDLVANFDADEAYDELKSQFPSWPLWMVKDNLISLHGSLRAEIDKPRNADAIVRK